MEMLGSILESVKIIFAPIGKCCNYHRRADYYMSILKDKWDDLECRKLDISSIMIAQPLLGKTPKQEIECWLQDVEKLNDEIQAIAREAAEGKAFSRAHVGKYAFQKIREVEELYQMGDFSDILVLDPPISNGEILLTSPTLSGQSTIIRIKDEIWHCMMDDDVRKIGIYGMGGIGKSTIMKEINNSLLNEPLMFDNVVWVNVSEAYNVIQLQRNIAYKLGLDLTEFADVRTRSSKLKAALKDRKRFVLILDDMCEAFDLESVGIPEPTSTNGCKLVLTTRLLDVCQGMGCKGVEMELLSKEEAWELFSNKVGRDVVNVPDLKPIAEEVLEICAQLPLAIVTVARSFKLLIHYYEWRDALERLRISVMGSNNIEEKYQSNNIEEQVLQALEFSYECLREDKLKRCLLHCALYPVDFQINKRELIEHLSDEGIIERMKTREAEFDRGYSMLSKLENACLLEGQIDRRGERFVKMNNLVRHMVLLVASPQFMVEDYLGLGDFSNELKWREDLVKASLMYKDISTIPSNVSPRYPNLSTLLLRGNRSLKHVPNSLFEHLHGLKVLDLSDTGIESLPNSVFSLENLSTLRLGGCRKLKHVASLAKLTALRKLDLGETRITEVPDGLEMLVNLKYLNLNARKLKIVPLGILPNLSHLQYLTVIWYLKSLTVRGEEIARLKKLETFRGHFYDTEEFSTFIRSLEKRRISFYQIQVGMSVDSICQKNEAVGKTVILEDCNLRRGDGSLVLPEDVQLLKIKKCHELKSLCDVPSLKHAKELNCICLEDCKGINHILSSSFTNSLQTLEILQLWKLDNLSLLFRKERAASALVSLGSFSHLKAIRIWDCSKIKKVFPLGLLLNLHNLERIDIFKCEQVEEIIGEASDEFEEEKEEKGMDITEITLPNLRVLSLQGLPELKTICNSSEVMVCNDLQHIWIKDCPKLMRLPFSLPILNEQLSPPPSLKEIWVDRSHWESLKGDTPDMKNVLQRFIH